MGFTSSTEGSVEGGCSLDLSRLQSQKTDKLMEKRKNEKMLPDPSCGILQKEKVELRSNEAQEPCPIASQHSSLLRCASRMRTCGKK